MSYKGLHIKRKTYKSIKPDFVIKVIEWLVLCSNTKTVHINLFSKIATELETVIQNRGPKEGIRVAKAARSIIFKFLSGDRSKETVLDLKRVLRASDLPNTVKAAIRLVFDDIIFGLDLRLVLTLFYSTRALNLPPVLETKSITESSPVVICNSTLGESPFGLIDLAKEFWNNIGIKQQRSTVPKRLRFKEFHLTTKSGPSGHALWSSMEDFKNLPTPLKRTLEVIGGPKIVKIFSTLEKYNPDISEFIKEYSTPILDIQKKEYEEDLRVKERRFKRRNPSKTFVPHKFKPYIPIRNKQNIRRISLIPDDEGKTRTVAILDYWSQTVLRPLHQYLFGFLKRIPQDCTFKQGSFLTKLKKTDIYYSIDLKSFTDRLPVDLNCMLLEQRFGKEYAEAWKNIMVGYPYKTPDGEFIHYSVGNPMGAFSSWNSSALTHHFIIFICCRNLGISWSDANYVLLGDDLCIGDKPLAEEYIRIIAILNMPYSSEKTHVSKTSYEFAKRFIVNNTELSPFPIKSLWSSRKNPLGFLATIISESQKGWFNEGFCALKLYDYWLDVCQFPSTFRKKKITALYPIHQIMMVLQGRLTDVEALGPLINNSYPSLTEHFLKQESLGLKPYQKLLKSIVKSCFEESFADDGRHTLGQLALEIMMFVTQYSESDVGPLKDSIPLLQVYGGIELSYLRLYREIYTLETLMEGDWKLSLRALLMPVSDRIFYLPNKNLKVYVSNKMSGHLTKYLESLVAHLAPQNLVDQQPLAPQPGGVR
jgi:hypothetical protein